jgi:hypothetical protein
MSVLESHIRYATSLIRLELAHTGHSTLADVGLGEQTINIIAQAPGQPRFGVHVSWIESESESFKIDEKLRAKLESNYLCPVYFVLAIALNRDHHTLRVEQGMLSKFLAVEPSDKVNIQVFDENECGSRHQAMVLEAFEIQGIEIKIILDKVMDQLRVVAHLANSGPIKDFDLRFNSAGPISLKDAQKLPAIARMAKLAKALVESGEVPITAKDAGL